MKTDNKEGRRGTARGTAVKEDVWFNTACNLCFSNCAIRVHRVDGVIVKIEGNPDSLTTFGGICARGASGMMLLYDPNRVNTPLKRTNPKKGIGVDPQWVEISWEEALDTITEKLRNIRAEDPRKLLAVYSVITGDVVRMDAAFTNAFGTPNRFCSGAGMHCGNGVHLFSGLMHCAWTKIPDTNYIKYYLNFGCPSGFGAYYSVTGTARRMADARSRGMKHVVIEPWMGMPGINSDEWVPIRPGTDAAMALAMINLLLNEYGIFDAESLQKYTNGPYLVKADGYYFRDAATGKPLLWDAVGRKAKTFDDPSLGEAALEGSFTVDGVKATTAFSLLKEHVRKYTPEMAAEITTVPAGTIRRLAREFGEAASIGKTIVVDGVEFPYRPVAVGFFKGAAGHGHSALTAMALELLQEIVGANNVPGGCLGMNSRSLGFPATGFPRYEPSAGPDGLVKTGTWQASHLPWPIPDAKKPATLGMNDLVPTSGDSPLFPWGILERDRYQIPYKTEFILHTSGNYLMATVDPAVLEKLLQEDIFAVSFSLYLDEATEFSDIVLPDTSYLERYDMRVDAEGTISPLDNWTWHVRQPVVAPMFQRRPAQEVLLEIADRLGILGDFYRQLNIIYKFPELYRLDPERKYTWEEIIDRRLKGNFGPEHGLEWFKEHGMISWPKRVEEVYWRPFIKARVPIYFEFFKTLGAQIDKIKEENGIPGFDTADFQALPDWKPCASYRESRPDFDLYAVYYRVPVQSFTSTYNNPFLDEVSRMDPYIFHVALNTDTARKKGIRDGDIVMVESAGTGYRVEARATLSETVHPEVMAYASGGGHWSKRLPIASQPGKGICPEWLIPLSWEQIDTVSLNLDLCVRVRVTKKAEPG